MAGACTRNQTRPKECLEDLEFYIKKFYEVIWNKAFGRYKSYGITMEWFGGILQEVEPCRNFPLDLFGTAPSGSGSMRMCTVVMYRKAKRL
jgi:hypothetical protein